MPQLHEWMFYEVMWRLRDSGQPYPFPWWIQQYFRHWSDQFDSGLFDSKEAAFASNANYRYWNMVGEPNLALQSLVGQAGEIEPVYDEYAVTFFLFDPAAKSLHLPQSAGTDGKPSALHQSLVDGWKPMIQTAYDSGIGVKVDELAYATRSAPLDANSWVRMNLKAQLTPDVAAAGGTRSLWLCVLISPMGPTGFQRHDNAGRYQSDRRLTFLRYVDGQSRVEVNSTFGPSFDPAPKSYGNYGNAGSRDPDFYLANNPFNDLVQTGMLNGLALVEDQVAGLCHGVYAWPMELTAQSPSFTLDVMLPVGDFQTIEDLKLMQPAVAKVVTPDGAAWDQRVTSDGLQLKLPPAMTSWWNQYRTSLSHLLILADRGEIHPGPTIYNSFWIRDSSVEGVAVALAGQVLLAEAQFGTHYKRAFNRGDIQLGDVSLDGFFGLDHEKNDREWDANGQALWALGKFDRIMGPAFNFGRGMFSPYIFSGARWIKNNRSPFGLLQSGWSAEHLGDKNQPHYWDDLWAVAGLWEAAKLAERIEVPQATQDELWSIYNAVRQSLIDSIHWSLTQQNAAGIWETFLPTGPGNVGQLNSSVIGAISYFQPCRLHIGKKLGNDIDIAMRATLDTIWSHFVDGGFKHDSAWNCYGPYLTMQLAHAFLFTGDLDRMEALLNWAAGSAAYPQVSRGEGLPPWQVALGAWNEQHCYPVASDFKQFPDRSWYMGDMPHGWACAEFMLLLRDMLFFEADEDADAHILLIPGVRPEWLAAGQVLSVQNARTLFGDGRLGFTVQHNPALRQVTITITAVPQTNLYFIYECGFGNVVAFEGNGIEAGTTPNTARISAVATIVKITY